MGVRLTEEEIDSFLTDGHTLIIATIRNSGEPLTTPLWYVWMDGSFWIRTGARSAKVQHVRRDPRVCCLVEEGKAWVDLKAVIANCDAEVIEDDVQNARVQAALDAKYADFKLDPSLLPDTARNLYGTGRVAIRMTPREGEVRTWYNRKMRLKTPA